jgi:long-subunit fatty acid transport protein
MKRYSFLFLTAALLAAPIAAQAAQFSVLGPRALGMGGASVAAVNDSTAVYWNPAALADYRKVDIRIPASAAIRDYAGLKTTWSDINNIYSAGLAGDPAAAVQLQQMLLDLNKPDAVTNLDASGGLLLSIPIAKSAIALSTLGIGYAEIIPVIDTYHLNTSTTPPPPANTIASNNSAATGIGIVTVEPAISLATSLGDSIFIGANAKMIYASTFIHSDYIRTGDYSTFISNLNNSETKSNKASIDAGILVKPVKNLNLGVVGRYLNSPSFPITGKVAVQQSNGDVQISTLPVTDEIELKPQYRAGVAWKPLDNLTLSADYDLSKNKSFTERTEDQTVAGGVELTILQEVLSLRAGAYKNTANTNANVVYTAGLGLRMAAFRLDLAGAYDFKEQEAQASASLALWF